MSIDRQKVIDAAQKFTAKNQFDKAVIEYQRVLREDPSDVRILLKVGDLQVRMSAKAAAVETYTKVAQAYDQQGFFLKGVAVYKQILQIDPTRIDLYGRLSELYLKLGLSSDALQSLELLAQRYAKVGDETGLSDVYRKMLSVDPGSVGTRIRLAELLSRSGRGEDAAKEFEAGASLLDKAGRVDEWSKVAERLFFHRPDDVQTALRLAGYYLERDDARRALPKLQVAYKANAKDVQTLELLAGAFRGLGQIQKTLSVLKEVARLHGDAGRARERNDVYQRVLELAPTDQEARDALRVGGRAAGRRTSSPPPPKKTESAPPASASRSHPASEEPDEVDAELLVVEDEPANFELKPTVPPGQDAASGVHLPPEANDAARSRLRAPVAAAPVARPFASPVAPPPPTSLTPVDRSPGAEAVRLVNEAEIFLKYGLRSKVTDHLGRASRLDPVTAELHVRIRDLYAAMNDPAGVLQECLQLAGILQESDPAEAEAMVRRALEIDPANALARQLLTLFSGDDGGAPEIEENSVVALVDSPEAEVYASSDHFREYLPDNIGSLPDDGAMEPLPNGEDGFPPRREIEDGLDEAEFFVTQGLYDDARDILLQLLEAHPNHPLVMDRWSEIEQILHAQEEGGDVEEAAPFADEIEALADPLWADGMAQDSAAEMHAVFDAASAGDPTSLSLEDCDTHYDLGIAYKEMGLLDDAIAEFRVATASPARRCIGELMLGICHVEKGDPATAIEHFRAGLQAPQRTEHEELGLYFEIGNAYELLGDIGEALYYLQKVEKHELRDRQRLRAARGHRRGALLPPEGGEARPDVPQRAAAGAVHPAARGVGADALQHLHGARGRRG